VPDRVLLGPAAGDLTFDQTPPEDVAGRVDVPDRVEQLAHLAPPLLIEQQVVPFRSGLFPDPPEGRDERSHIERLRRALHRAKPEAIKCLVRKVKAVERRNDGDPVTSLFADQPDQRPREPRLADTRRPGDSEQESPPRCVDRRE
jgi:hypothetical protein